jgi:carbonic anhydrase
MITGIQDLLRNNERFVAAQLALDPDYFRHLSEGQHPAFLWIGCSDSRVPPDRITGTQPGDMFVHRNIANLVVQTDMNLLSVLQYAVDVLEVEHVIVCGHYGCTGVSAALEDRRVGLADNWLRHIQDVHAKHDARVQELPDLPRRIDRLCELNVIEQVANVCQTTIVRDAWDRGQELAVHGWVYGLSDGLLRDLGTTVTSPAAAPAKYLAALAAL